MGRIVVVFTLSSCGHDARPDRQRCAERTPPTRCRIAEGDNDGQGTLHGSPRSVSHSPRRRSGGEGRSPMATRSGSSRHNLQLLASLPAFFRTAAGYQVERDQRALGEAHRYAGNSIFDRAPSGRHVRLRCPSDKNLALLGYRGVEFFGDEPNIVSSVDVDPLPGYVLANGIELKRPFARTGSMSAPLRTEDGQPLFVDEARLNDSVNATLGARGPCLCRTLRATMPIALIERLRAIIAQASGEWWWNVPAAKASEWKNRPRSSRSIRSRIW